MIQNPHYSKLFPDSINPKDGKLFKVSKQKDDKGKVVACLSVDRRLMLNPEAKELIHEMIAQTISSRVSEYVAKHHDLPLDDKLIEECMDGATEKIKEGFYMCVGSCAIKLLNELMNDKKFMSSSVHRAIEIVDGNIEGGN